VLLLVSATDFYPGISKLICQLAHNTDAFDVSSSNVIIENRFVYALVTLSYSYRLTDIQQCDQSGLSEQNPSSLYLQGISLQDDCLAINSGSNITFANNYCCDGHGISIVSHLTFF